MNREEAIDIIRKNIPHLGIGAAEMTEALNELIPELRESEDEEIRKDIIGGLMWQRDNLKSEGPHDNNLILPGFCLTVGEHLKYMEKQKESKHAPDDLQKSFEAGQASIVDNPEQYGLCKKPELVQQPPITYTYNSNASRDERLKAALLALLNSDLLKVKEGGYFTKQDLIEWVERIPTDKPAEWSEEDAVILNCCISSIEEAKENRYAYKETDGDTSYDREIAFLKSLRPSWKPREEQMDALKELIDDANRAGWVTPGATELYEQLKKL